MRVRAANEESFEIEVIQSDLPVLVDFWAPWCEPCRTVALTLGDLAEEVAGRASVVSVNTDDHPDLARRFGIRALPTVVLFSGGGPRASTVGIRPLEEYRRLLESAR
jgi:thioredoxin 1